MSSINSSKAPEPVGLYPHAKRVGNLLFLSGVGPRERGTKKIPGVELDGEGNIASYDIEAQCHSVFKNVKAILEDAGSSWNKIVDVTVYLTNMKEDFPEVQ
jgi:2-aminomuconate deaminase